MAKYEQCKGSIIPRLNIADLEIYIRSFKNNEIAKLIDDKFLDLDTVLNLLRIYRTKLDTIDDILNTKED